MILVPKVKGMRTRWKKQSGRDRTGFIILRLQTAGGIFEKG